MATTLVIIPVPLTTFLKILEVFSTILIGTVFSFLDSEFLNLEAFTLERALEALTPWSQDPSSYSESLLSDKEES